MTDLAELLLEKYPAAEQRPSKIYGPKGQEYGVDYVEPPPIGALAGLRFGFRGMPQAKFPGPWAKDPVPAPKPTREWKEPGDDSVGQHVWEALLGRTRKPGEAVAQPGSGWWMIGKQPIPKPTNPLPWVATGGIGYLSNKLWGDPVGATWRSFNDPTSPEYKVHTPGTQEYEAEQKRRAESQHRYERDMHQIRSRGTELEHFYGPEANQYGLPYGMEGLRRLGQLPRREATLPSMNGIPFPPDPNRP